MLGIFYVVTASLLSLLPALSDYTYIAILIFFLTLISPVRILLVQWIVFLLWLGVANFSYDWAPSSFQVPDEYYLYLLHASVFIVGAPVYISHSKTFNASRMNRFLILARFILLVFAPLLLLSAFFRSFYLSNVIWAVICFTYGYYLPRRASPMRTSELMNYTVLFIILAVVTALLFEAGVRLLFLPPPKSSDYYMPHKEAIFTFRPNTSGPVVMKNNDGDIISPTIQISSQGIRDREFRAKDEGTFRIVMIGDSFTMGHGLEPHETIGFILEYLFLEENIDHGVEVINCGVGAYAPWQERIFLQERGFGFEPDLVILQLYPSNDVASSYSKVQKYLHAIDLDWEYRLADYRRKNEMPARVEQFCRRSSSAYRVFVSATGYKWLVRDMIRNFRFLKSTPSPKIVPRSNRPYNEEVCLVDWYPDLEEAWGIFEESVQGIRDDCRERGVDLIAYVHGSIISLRPEDWENLNKAFPDTPYEMNKDIRVTNEMLEKLKIPYVDVLAAIQNYAVEDIFYIYDGHFTPKGAEVVATSLRDYLMENYFGKQ